MERRALDAIAYAGLHFAGGAVGEAEAEHAFGVNAIVDRPCSTFGKGHGLTGAHWRHDEHRLVPLVYDDSLQVVELHLSMITGGGIN